MYKLADAAAQQVASPRAKKRVHEDEDFNDDDGQALVPLAKSSKRETPGSARIPFGENRRSSFIGKVKSLTRSLSQRGGSLRGGSLRGGSLRRRNSTRHVPTMEIKECHHDPRTTVRVDREDIVPPVIADFIMSAEQAETDGLSDADQKRRHILAEIIEGELRLNTEMLHVLRIYLDSKLLPISDLVKDVLFGNYEQLFELSNGRNTWTCTYGSGLTKACLHAALLKEWRTCTRSAAGLPLLAEAVVAWVCWQSCTVWCDVE
jgi:hypothetical protein